MNHFALYIQLMNRKSPKWS